MKKNVFILLIFTLFTFDISAQKYPGFIPAYERFSNKKVVYLMLKDNTKVEGTIKDLDRKKGLIEEIDIKPTGQKKSVTYSPEELQNAYLEPTALNKILKIDNQILRINKLGKYNINNDLVDKGYVYFESSLAQITKRKEDYVLLQLLNPTFTGRIRVFDDPLAQESMGLGIGGMTLVGGDEKSYYLKKDEEKAYRLRRAKIDDDFLKLFGDCPAVIKAAEGKIKWLDLNKYVYIYNTECAE
jgi:hypothetical protein